MRPEFLTIINTVCKEGGIDLRISDIKDCRVYHESKELYETVFLHCRNDQEMFEFLIVVIELPTKFDIVVTEVKGSPYSCDNLHITIDK